MLNLMTVAKDFRLLKSDGWSHVAQEVRHRQIKHPTKRGRFTEVKGGSLPSISGFSSASDNILDTSGCSLYR